MIEPGDEDVHGIGTDEHWQESWYFNWADPERSLFGLSRIGFRYHQSQVDGLVLSLRGGRPEYLYPGVNRRQSEAWTAQSAAGGLRAGRLTFRMEEPLRRWRLLLRGRHEMDLTFEAFTPAFDYRHGGELPRDVAGAHFEQSGRVTGRTRFRGRDTAIDGCGQRDRSWGVRDWARVAGWDWIAAQFGEDLSFSVWRGLSDGRPTVSGFVFRDGENHAVERLDLRYEWRRPHRPRSARIQLYDGSGHVHRVDASALGRFPLWKRGLWVEEVPASFTCERPGGAARRGIGVIEHAWHAGTLGTLRHAGDLLSTAVAALRR
jgi:hypothetical protein